MGGILPYFFISIKNKKYSIFKRNCRLIQKIIKKGVKIITKVIDKGNSILYNFR